MHVHAWHALFHEILQLLEHLFKMVCLPTFLYLYYCTHLMNKMTFIKLLLCLLHLYFVYLFLWNFLFLFLEKLCFLELDFSLQPSINKHLVFLVPFFNIYTCTCKPFYKSKIAKSQLSWCTVLVKVPGRPTFNAKNLPVCRRSFIFKSVISSNGI